MSPNDSLCHLLTGLLLWFKAHLAARVGRPPSPWNNANLSRNVCRPMGSKSGSVSLLLSLSGWMKREGWEDRRGGEAVNNIYFSSPPWGNPPLCKHDFNTFVCLCGESVENFYIPWTLFFKVKITVQVSFTVETNSRQTPPQRQNIHKRHDCKAKKQDTLIRAPNANITRDPCSQGRRYFTLTAAISVETQRAVGLWVWRETGVEAGGQAGVVCTERMLLNNWMMARILRMPQHRWWISHQTWWPSQQKSVTTTVLNRDTNVQTNLTRNNKL